MPFNDIYPATDQVNEREYRLLQPLVYINENENLKLTVPPGFITDYGSVPQVFWNIIPPQGVLAAAYILHDWLYATEAFERTKCDWIFLCAMQELGASWVKRNTIYSAVRCFGGAVWKAHTPEGIADARKLLAEYEGGFSGISFKET